MISPSQRPLPDNTQHSQHTNIQALGGIRIHNLSRRAAEDLRLRPRGHWDRRFYPVAQNRPPTSVYRILLREIYLVHCKALLILYCISSATALYRILDNILDNIFCESDLYILHVHKKKNPTSRGYLRPIQRS